MAKIYNDGRNANQIYKKNGNGVFLEVLAPEPDFQKITIKISKYNVNNDKGNRIEKTYSYFLSLPEILGLCRYVNNGSIKRMSDKIKKDNSNQVIWSKQGGSPASKGNPPRCRILSIIPATRSRYADVIFKIEEGEARVTKEGLFAPAGRLDALSVGITFDELYGMCEYIKVRIQAFATWMQMSGNYTYSGKTQEQPPEPIKDEPEERTDYGSNAHENYNTLFYNVG